MQKFSLGAISALAVLCFFGGCDKKSKTQHQFNSISPATTNQTISAMEKQILSMADSLHDFTFGVHQHIAEHPETAWNEFNTTQFIAKHLDSLGIPYRIGRKGVGIIAEITCQEPDLQTVFLRADIDQLPVSEEPDYPKIVKSKVPGLSAACGHSAHLAWGLSATRILWHLRDKMKGRIIILFSPPKKAIK